MAHSHDNTLLQRLGFADPDKKNPKHDLACRYLVLDEQAQRLTRLVKFRTPNGDPDRALAEINSDIESLTRLRSEEEATRKIASDVFERILRSTPRDDRDDLYRRLRAQEHAETRAAAHVAEAARKRLRETEERLRSDALSAKKRVSDIQQKITQRGNEVPISKGKGQYKTTIGFLDAFIAGEATWSVRTVGSRSDNNAFVATYVAYDYTEAEGNMHRLDAGMFAVAVEVKIGREDVSSILRQMLLYREHFVAPREEPITWVAALAFDLTQNEIDTLKREKIHTIRLGAPFEKWCEEQKAAKPGEAEEF